MSNAPFDMGAKAARRGKSKKDNPFDMFKRAAGCNMNNERKASEWNEGFESVPKEDRKKTPNATN